MLPKTTSAKNWSIDRSFFFWHLRYILNELAHSTVAGLLIAITLILSFLLHDSDIARIGQGLLRGERIFCGGYLTVALAYCMTVAGPLFRESSLRDFTESLPFTYSTKALSLLVYPSRLGLQFFQAPIISKL